MKTLNDDTVEKLFDFALNVEGPKTWWITRLAMYNALKNKFLEFDSTERTCIAVGESAKFGRDVLGLNLVRYIEANYPEHNMADLKFADEVCDFCISDQVLEHVEGNPFKAFAESARVVRAGGYVCHTTCLINQVHGVPKDFWRFTPDALTLLATESGLEPICVGGWGNREIGSLMHMKQRFAPIPDDPRNPVYQLAMKNDPDWPISVWIIARKP